MGQVYDRYKITRGKNGRERKTRIARSRPVAPNNTGPKSMPNYEVLRQQALVPLRGGLKSFAGQADDPFPCAANAHDAFSTQPPHYRVEPTADPVGPLPPG